MRTAGIVGLAGLGLACSTEAVRLDVPDALVDEAASVLIALETAEGLEVVAVEPSDVSGEALPGMLDYDGSPALYTAVGLPAALDELGLSAGPVPSPVLPDPGRGLEDLTPAWIRVARVEGGAAGPWQDGAPSSALSELRIPHPPGTNLFRCDTIRVQTLFIEGDMMMNASVFLDDERMLLGGARLWLLERGGDPRPLPGADAWIGPDGFLRSLERVGGRLFAVVLDQSTRGDAAAVVELDETGRLRQRVEWPEGHLRLETGSDGTVYAANHRKLWIAARPDGDIEPELLPAPPSLPELGLDPISRGSIDRVLSLYPSPRDLYAVVAQQVVRFDGDAWQVDWAPAGGGPALIDVFGEGDAVYVSGNGVLLERVGPRDWDERESPLSTGQDLEGAALGEGRLALVSSIGGASIFTGDAWCDVQTAQNRNFDFPRVSPDGTWFVITDDGEIRENGERRDSVLISVELALRLP